MKKIPCFFLCFFAFVVLARGQAIPPAGQATRVRSATSLPATCQPGSATAAADTIIVNNVPYVCTGTFSWSVAPWIDVTTFGARTMAGAWTGTANCTAGSNQLTSVSSNGYWGTPNGLQVSDGITLYGCGAKETMATPTGLSVTPSGTWGLTGTESPITVTTGSATYSYSIIARDAAGGLTLPETPVTIMNGVAIGKQTATIRTLSRSDDVVTVVTSASTPLVAGELIQLEPKSGAEFYGWFNVAKVDSPTQFELWVTPFDTRAQGWMNGDTTTNSSGGTVIYYRMNFLKWKPIGGAWLYYICAKRTTLGDTSYHLIGQTKPSGPTSGYIDASFEDYGTPYEDLQTYPLYVQTSAEATYNNNATNIANHTTSNAICTASSVLNDPLSTTVTGSPNGGATITLAANAGQSMRGASGTWDDSPGVRAALAAATSAKRGAAVYFPPTVSPYPYQINSHTVVPSNVTVYQAGTIALKETLTLSANVNWIGDFGSYGTPQFGFTSNTILHALYANPGVYLNGAGIYFRNVSIAGTNANGAVAVVDDAATSTYENVNFGTGDAPTDYTGMAIVIRGIGSIQQHFFSLTSFNGGPDQVNDASWTPLFWIAPGQNLANVGIETIMDRTIWNRRGMAFGGAGNTGTYGNSGTCPSAQFTSRYSYRQGGIVPMVASQGCPSYTVYTFDDVSQDTEGQPLLANLNSNPAAGNYGSALVARLATGGATNPLITGLRSSYAEITGPFNSAHSFPDRDILYPNKSLNMVLYPYETSAGYNTHAEAIYTMGFPFHGVGGYSWWFDLPAPSNVTVKAATSGRVPADTYVYAVSSTGADGGETIASPPSAKVTTSTGTQTVNVGWTKNASAYSSNVYRCVVSTGNCTNSDGSTNAGGTWYRVAQHIAGTTFSDTSASPTRVVLPAESGTGATIFNANGTYSPFFQPPPITVSQLPAAAAGNSGQIRRVTDSTAITTEGQTCAGGSTNAAMAFSNGSVWKCF